MNKEEEVIKDNPEPEVDKQVEEPSTEADSGMSEEKVRKICEEIIGAFLDKFVPPEAGEDEEAEEAEDLTEESLEY